MTLPRIKTIIIVVLVSLLSVSAYVLREEIKNGARLALGIEKLEQEMSRQKDTIVDLLDQQKYISKQNTVLRDDLKQIQKKTDTTNSLLIKLGKEDEEYINWSNNSLPESILERLLQQRENGNSD